MIDKKQTFSSLRAKYIKYYESILASNVMSDESKKMAKRELANLNYNNIKREGS